MTTLGSLVRAAVCLALVCAAGPPALAETLYAWRAGVVAEGARLEDRFAPPPGFERLPAEAGSFAAWLRGLPMKAEGAPVLLHTGARKWRQDVHAGVVDIDVGARDLQQCADAVMRLRAEWLFALGRKAEIAFNDTKGKRLRFSDRARQDHAGLRKYMDFVFAYAGTYSLERELAPAPAEDIRRATCSSRAGFRGMRCSSPMSS